MQNIKCFETVKQETGAQPVSFYGSKTTEPRRRRWQSTATTTYNGTGSQTQIAQIHSTLDVKPVNAAEHTDKLPSVPKINNGDVKIHTKRLSELPQFPSISPPFPYIRRFPYNFLLLTSELYRTRTTADADKPARRVYTGYCFLLVFYRNFFPNTHRFWDIRLQ